MRRLIVAIPAFNEQRTIRDVIERLQRNFPQNLDCFVLVVDDGSTDQTVEIAKNAGADIIVSHAKNYGVGLAYKSAIKYALKYNADIICTIDADAQFYPEEVNLVIYPVQARQAEVVIGSRFISENNSHDVPIITKISNRLMALFVSQLIGYRLYDVESGFRSLSAHAAKKLDLMGIGSFSHDMIQDLAAKGIRAMEVPVSVKYYKNRTSRAIKGVLRYGLKSLLSMLIKSLTIKKLVKKSYTRNCIASVGHESTRISPNME
jgi:glycosyltransferase involved in cell wall biosynthesis